MGRKSRGRAPSLDQGGPPPHHALCWPFVRVLSPLGLRSLGFARSGRFERGSSRRQTLGGARAPSAEPRAQGPRSGASLRRGPCAAGGGERAVQQNGPSVSKGAARARYPVLGRGGAGGPLGPDFRATPVPQTQLLRYICVFGSQRVPRISLGSAFGAGPGRSFRNQNRSIFPQVAIFLPGSRTKSGPGGPPRPPCPMLAFCRALSPWGLRVLGFARSLVRCGQALRRAGGALRGPERQVPSGGTAAAS